MRKILSGLLVLTLLCVFAPRTQAAFGDVPSSHFAYGSITNLTEQGIFDSTRNFYPNQAITRGDFLLYLMQASSGAQEMGESLQEDYLEQNYSYARFKDVAISASYAPAVLWAAEQGYISGYADGLFRPNNSLNRAEAAKLFMQVFLSGQFVTGVSAFRDLDATAWYYPYMLSVANAGILRGYQDVYGNLTGYIKPGQTITRAEAAVMLERAMYSDIETLTEEENPLTFTAQPASKTTLTVTFSEAVPKSAFATANFTLKNEDDDALAISAVNIQSGTKATFATAVQDPDEVYTLLVKSASSADGTKTLLTKYNSAEFFGYTAGGGSVTVESLLDKTDEVIGLPAYASQVDFLKLRFTADDSAGVILADVTVQHRGVGGPEELSNLALRDSEGNVLGSKSKFNSDNEAFLRFRPQRVLEAGEVLDVTITGDFIGAEPESSHHRFEIASKGMMTLMGKGTLSTDENFSIKGPEYRRLSAEGGWLKYSYFQPPATVELGEDSTLLQAVVEAREEDIQITRVAFQYTGTLSEDYLTDLELRIGGRRMGGRIERISDDEFAFNLQDSPHTIDKNTRELLTLRAEITGGTSASVLVRFKDAGGIEGSGERYGFGVAAVLDTSSLTPVAQTVTGTSLQIAKAPDNPTGYTLYAGESKQTVAKFEFTAPGDGIVLENLRFRLETSKLQNQFFESLKFYWVGTEMESFTPENEDGVQYFEVEGPMTIPAGRSRTLTVKAEFSESYSEELGYFQVFFEALTAEKILFQAERVVSEDALKRSDILPTGEVTLAGGKFRVKGEEEDFTDY